MNHNTQSVTNSLTGKEVKIAKYNKVETVHVE
jgi:hypothetical protein